MDKSVQNHKANKIRKIFSNILTVLIVIVSVFAIAISVFSIYINNTYDRFFVDGQSMYPTLNNKAKYSDGTLIGKNGSSVDNGSTMVDYGVMDKHDIALKHLKRFDVIICNYSSSDSSDKIKRIVGLPGETIKFTTEGKDKGDLYVKNGDDFELIPQPIANEYKASSAATYPEGNITLGNDEYLDSSPYVKDFLFKVDGLST